MKVSGVCGVLLVALCAGSAAADDGDSGDNLPAGRFGMSVGVRQGGGLLNQYGIALVAAAEAGYLLSDPEQDVTAGLAWSVVWGWFGPDDQASLTGALHTLEFNFGARLRRRWEAMPLPAFLYIGSGITLLRSNVPLPPEQKRVYVGPYAAAGLEGYWTRTMNLSLEVRYGLVVGGPGSLSLVLGIGFGR